MSVLPVPPENREILRPLIEAFRPGDALAAYYALHHPAAKTRLWIHRSPGGEADGFLARAQTGQDLFRPLVTLRARDPSAMVELLRAGLPAGQPAVFSLPEPLSLWLLPFLSVDSQRLLKIFHLDRARFEPVLNIFVQRAWSPDGLPRYEIRQGETLVAAAGVNWKSPLWAEIFVQTDPEHRERGYGKSVCAALCADLLATRHSILFAVEESNHASIRLAKSLAFADTGERELLLTGSFKQSQN